MVWSLYDKDNSGSLEKKEVLKLFKDIAKVA